MSASIEILQKPPSYPVQPPDPEAGEELFLAASAAALAAYMLASSWALVMFLL